MRDWMAFQVGKTGQRFGHWFASRPRVRPHREVLGMAIREVLDTFADPVCVETGCIRREGEGTDSTLAIAEALEGKGTFFTFELDKEHIETCRRVCRRHLEHIRFVQGDAVRNLEQLKSERTLSVLHFAFFDSADDPEQTLAEFQAVQDLFVPGSILIVDDAIRGVKGKQIKPVLHRSPEWITRLVHSGNGMLLATKLGKCS
jgi:cephalosporin hydroxylase